MRHGRGRAQVVRSVLDRLLVVAARRTGQPASAPNRREEGGQRLQLPECKYMCSLPEAARVLVQGDVETTAVSGVQGEGLLSELEPSCCRDNSYFTQQVNNI